MVLQRMAFQTMLVLVVLSTTLLASTNAATVPPSDTPFGHSTRAKLGSRGSATKNPKVIILGGGVSGVIAARTLHENGIDDFLIIEAREELGGRMQTHTFGGKTGGSTRSYVVEKGPNWVQGTQEADGGPANPIYTLAKKHGLKGQLDDGLNSLTTYDQTGQVDYLDVVKRSIDHDDASIKYAGNRVDRGLVDLSARTGYLMVNAKPKSAQEIAAEYFQFDYEYAQTPEQSSHIASSWNTNYTYDTSQGGFSEDNIMSVDQRGFKTIIQAEAQTFLKPSQVLLNSTVKSIHHSDKGVTVTLSNGKAISADFALCTFSLGVLQNDDVSFEPSLPEFKKEAIHSMVMATYIKIFLQFPTKFWFDTEMGIYADSERGRYPIWQNLDHPNYFPGSKILFVTVTGDFAERIETLPETQVKSEVMNVLQTMFPNVTGGIPEPIDFFFPKWHSNPLFRGSYSNWPPSFTSQHMDNLRANVGRLYFAGEATSLKYFGFLQGAYTEGQSMARSIAACLKTNNNKCSPLKYYANTFNSVPYQRP